MLFVVAANEPWGTYHFEPLLSAAERLGIELVQFCPDFSRVPQAAAIAVSDDPGVFEQADLAAVNGLASSHTVRAACLAGDAGLPLAFCELAYLSPATPPLELEWSSVSCVSQASRAVVESCSGSDRASIVGWPGNDDLPELTSSGVLAVSSGPDQSPVSQDWLFDFLSSFEGEVRVRPHPRDPPGVFAGFRLDESYSAAEAVASASAVVGVPGSTCFAACALGVPWFYLGPSPLPRSLRRLASPCASLPELLAVLDDPPLLHPNPALCGPVGGSSERLLNEWVSAVHLAF